MNRDRRLTFKSPKPDMTPMLDIVFILIIFFAVTAAFGIDHAIEPYRPYKVPKAPQSKEPTLVFELGADTSIIRNGVPIDVWSAEAMMKQFHTEHEDKPVVLKLSEGSKLKLMVRMYDAANHAGYQPHEIVVL